jgi:hypothetical protein
MHKSESGPRQGPRRHRAGFRRAEGSDGPVHSHGLDRARTKIGLANLTYNFKRLVGFERQSAMA